MMSGVRVILHGDGARVVATPDLVYRADVSSEALGRVLAAGRMPEELRQKAADWINAVLSLAAIETDFWNDRESSFTRRALIGNLTRFRRQVARGRTSSAPHPIEQHLLDTETARLRYHRLGERCWGPLAHSTYEQFAEVRREAVARVNESRGVKAALLALLDDAVIFLRTAPERSSEIMARRGRLDPVVPLVTLNVGKFWTQTLGRRDDDLKGQVALADIVWRLIGQPKHEPAIREAFTRHRKHR
jgi:hypothetical protein